MMKSNSSLQIVLVLYKCTTEESSSYQTFMANRHALTLDYELIIYNNSPETTVAESDLYHLAEDKNNGMLAGAYNYALLRANQQNREWLLLLDQDTKLTSSFLQELTSTISKNPNVSAIIPITMKGTFHISPLSYNSKLGNSWMTRPVEEEGETKLCLSAINTCATLRVKTMNELGGFSSLFPLDSLDHWYFYKMYLLRESTWILKSKIEHDISLLDETNVMSENRYRSFLESGLKFSKIQGVVPTLLWKLRCLARAVKYIFSKKKRIFCSLLFAYVLK
ncbi:MAG TPA: glycosyltransferase [Paludibacteraceae bacterium]|nr:glycosyltransferase [Paludibacteraceae bacterium]